MLEKSGITSTEYRRIIEQVEMRHSCLIGSSAAELVTTEARKGTE